MYSRCGLDGGGETLGLIDGLFAGLVGMTEEKAIAHH